MLGFLILKYAIILNPTKPTFGQILLYQNPINHAKIPTHLMWLSVHFFKIGLFAHSARQTIPFNNPFLCTVK
ncbi:hypothetical protein B0182_02725 [Moraxella bovis]|nr:hypothetical protein DQF64_05665 [Moraxella bovis]OOR91384.1 hypothetical protein B0182_02725 [Moraxella bovis]